MHFRPFLPLLLAAFPATLPAQVDRECDTQVAYEHLRHASLVDIQTWSAQGYRMSNFEMNGANPTELNVSMVRNTGPYAASWLYVYDKTQAQLVSTITNGNYRIVDLERYSVAGVDKFAALLFVNSGQQQKAWFWHAAIPEGSVWSTVNGMGHRVIDLEPYVVDGERFFHVVSIANTGSDLKAWWVYTATTPGGVQSYMAQHDARLYDFETTSIIPSEAACVLVRDGIVSQTHWGEYYGSGFDLDEQMGGRVSTLSSYSLGTWCVTLIDNLDPFLEYGGGCPGTHGTSSHWGSGTAMTGTQVTLRANELWPWTIAIVFYGSSSTWLSLAPLGAPGCFAWVDPFTSLNCFANAAGVATQSFTVPVNPSLHDLDLFTQVAALDPPLNALGLQVSNGVATRLRHW